jgi:hypothetical protein
MLALPWPSELSGGVSRPRRWERGWPTTFALRRALGYRLARPEKLLGLFVDHLEQTGEPIITVAARSDRRGWRPTAIRTGRPTGCR